MPCKDKEAKRASDAKYRAKMREGRMHLSEKARRQKFRSDISDEQMSLFNRHADAAIDDLFQFMAQLVEKYGGATA